MVCWPVMFMACSTFIHVSNNITHEKDETCMHPFILADIRTRTSLFHCKYDCMRGAKCGQKVTGLSNVCRGSEQGGNRPD